MPIDKSNYDYFHQSIYENAVKKYNEIVNKLERASKIAKEIKRVDHELNTYKTLTAPEQKPVISFEGYCKLNNIPTADDFSFPSFSEYCSKNGIKQTADDFSFPSFSEYCSKNKIEQRVPKPKYKKEFWDDAEKYFTYDYFKYEYGFFLVAFSRDEKYRKYRSQYAGTKIETFLKELKAKKLSFSEKLKAPRQYHDEFLVLLNKLRNELRNEWDDYDKCQIIYEKAKQEYDQELSRAEEDYYSSYEMAKRKYDEELSRAKEDHKAFLEDYYSKNSVRENYELDNLKKQRKYEDECVKYRTQKEREPEIQSEKDKLNDEFSHIADEVGWITLENVESVLSYVKTNYADTIDDLLECWDRY